ncbi:hypothetical protein, partial [Actinocorallia lasiicapitis]
APAPAGPPAVSGPLHTRPFRPPSRALRPPGLHGVLRLFTDLFVLRQAPPRPVVHHVLRHSRRRPLAVHRQPFPPPRHLHVNPGHRSLPDHDTRIRHPVTTPVPDVTGIPHRSVEPPPRPHTTDRPALGRSFSSHLKPPPHDLPTIRSRPDNSGFITRVHPIEPTHIRFLSTPRHLAGTHRLVGSLAVRSRRNGCRGAGDAATRIHAI